MNTRIPTLLEKVVVLRKLNRKPPLLLPVGIFLFKSNVLCSLIPVTGVLGLTRDKSVLKIKGIPLLTTIILTMLS